MYWWAPTFYLSHCNCDWLNHTTCSNGNGLYIPCGIVAAILFPEEQVVCNWLNHTTWFHSNRALSRSMEFDSMLPHFFYTIQMSICYVGSLMIANTWIYIFLYIRNTAILENNKSVCIFPHQRVNTCYIHLNTSETFQTYQSATSLMGLCEHFFKVY